MRTAFRIFTGSLALVLGFASPASGGTVAGAMVAGNVEPGGYAYPGQGASGGTTDSGNPAWASFYAAATFRGLYIHHGVDTDLELGQYDVRLEAYAFATYGAAELLVRNYSDGASWLGPSGLSMDNNVRAEAAVSDTLLAASSEAQWVELGFDVTVTSGNARVGDPGVVINGEYFYVTGRYVYSQLVFGQNREVPLYVNLFREISCSGYPLFDDDCHESAEFSVRLTDARVWADHGPEGPRLLGSGFDGIFADDPYLVADQRIFTQNYYRISNIQQVPEPSTLWLCAGMLAAAALRRLRRTIA